MEELKGERKLAEYWKAKTGLTFSDFEMILGEEAPEEFGLSTRERALELDPGRDRYTVSELKAWLAGIILQGFPLSRMEYYLACAFGQLSGEGITHDEFYKTQWHETPTHRAYGSSEQCERCRKELMCDGE